MPSQHEGICRLGDYTGMILYRQPPFQVELWILPPNTESPAHAHPNVDIYLVHVCGEIRVWVDEKLVLGPAETVPDQRTGVTKTNGNFIRLLPGQVHRAGTGPMGGAFINVQHWLEGNPRFTSEDWTGDGLNEHHKKKLENAHRHEYVRSLRENSGGLQMVPKPISRKDSGIPASPEASTRKPLDGSGEERSDAATEKFGSWKASMAKAGD